MTIGFNDLGDFDDIKTIVMECARELGFVLLRVASAEKFASDRTVALDRIKAGFMDGLPL